MDSESEPMRQIHDIRERNYYETRHMSANEYLEHIRKKALRFEEYRKSLKIPENLDAFYEELKNKRKAS